MSDQRKAPPKKCEHCGASMNEHRHKLNVPLMKALYFCAKTYKKEPFKISQLDKVAYCNFQSLRYWGLIEPHFEKGDRKGGMWKVTPSGLGFCMLTSRVPEVLWSYRGKRVADSWEKDTSKWKLITQIDGGYDYCKDYEEVASGHNGIQFP